MSRYIDVNKVKLKGIAVFDENLDALIPLSDVRKALALTPTADVVAVVRCKDCKHLTVINNESAYARCEKTGYIFWSFRTDTREHFCAYGERKEDGK